MAMTMPVSVPNRSDQIRWEPRSDLIYLEGSPI
jgi:hypothetical protein